MKYEYKDALEKGKLVKSQSFHTHRGDYVIHLIAYKNDIYFFKILNGEIVECCNLNKRSKENE